MTGDLFAPGAPSRPARRRNPPKQTTVTITAEAIAAVRAGRIVGEGVIKEAIRAARPDVRNVAVDLGTVRWTDPKSGKRVTFRTPDSLRYALTAMTRGERPEPFRFILGRAARVTRDGN
jgi:hypothetical protein